MPVLSPLHVCLACLCCMSALHVCVASLSCISVLHVCLACLCCIFVLHVCVACLLCMSVLHVCGACLFVCVTCNQLHILGTPCEKKLHECRLLGCVAVVFVCWDVKPVFYTIWSPFTWFMGYSDPRKPTDDLLHGQHLVLATAGLCLPVAWSMCSVH